MTSVGPPAAHDPCRRIISLCASQRAAESVRTGREGAEDEARHAGADRNALPTGQKRRQREMRGSRSGRRTVKLVPFRALPSLWTPRLC